MSKTIDQRVVEMRFDNKQFESATATTMSTIDKLKQKLNFTGATKGLEDVSNAAKKVNLSGLGSAVETVQAKFSALQVVGVTALANITNSAINAGKNIVSALTIDPIRTGFQEYETQMNAVQTILANTSHAGTTLDDVTAALDELNKYADQTIYNFTEMTRNIGTFTAAGVDLDTSVGAIKGIANLAAISGSTSQQASTAMYQLSQALAAGRVSLQDWNSVVNAGMGGKVFQDALVNTAEAMGIVVDKSVSFRESISATGGKESWLTADVLLNTLNQFTGDLTDAELAAMGFTQEQIKNIQSMAVTANDAATKVKTLTQLWDTMKEAVQSGWAQSWKLIIGDFEEAKARLTDLSNYFADFIQKSADSRNDLLAGALNPQWDQLIEQINEAGVATEDFNKELEKTLKTHGRSVDYFIKKYGSLGEAFKQGALSSDMIVETLKRMAGVSSEASKATEDMTGKLEYFQKVVNDVWMGDYKNGEERVKALTAAGYDYAQVQDLVNKTVDGYKLTLEDLTDVQLKSVGYTDDEVKALRELAKQAEETGTPLNQLIENLSKPSGRELLWESLFNILDSVAKVLGAVGEAWRDAFPPMTSQQLYNIIEAFHAFTEDLVPSEDTIKNLTRTLKGLFAILDIITTLVGGGFKLAFKAVTTILGMADIDVLSFTARIGDMIVGFRNWLFETNSVAKGLKYFVSGCKEGIAVLRSWINEIIKLPQVQSFLKQFNLTMNEAFSGVKDHFGEGIERVREFIKRVQELDSISLSDIKKVLKDFKENVIDYFFDFDNMISRIKAAVSKLKTNFTTNFKAAGNVIADFAKKVAGFAKSIVDKITSVVDVSSLLLIGIGVAIVMFAKSLLNAIDLIAGPLDAFTDVLDGLGDVLSAYALNLKADALKKVAISIGILAGSIFVLTQLDQKKMWSVVGALGVLSIGLVGVTAAIGALQKVGKSVEGSFTFISIAGSILILVMALKKVEELDRDSLWDNIKVLGVLAGGLAAVAGILGKVAPKLSSGSITLVSMAISLKILVSALGDLNNLNLDGIGEKIPALISVVLMMGLLGKAFQSSTVKTKGFKSSSGSSAIGMLGAIISLKLLIGAIEDIANIDTNKIYNNLDAFIAIFGMFSVLMLSSHFAGSNAAKAGIGILAMSAALGLMVPAMKEISEIDPAGLDRASSTIYKLLLVFGAVSALTKFSGSNAVRSGAMALMMSGAITILAGAMIILSKIDPAGLDRALDAIITLEIIFGALIAVTRIANGAKAPIIALTVMLGIMAASLAGLSFVDPEGLKRSTEALTIVMGMFSLMVASTAIAKKASGTIVIMTIVVGALAAILYSLKDLPVESTLVNATALSELLLAISAALLILSGVKSIGVGALVSLGIMILILPLLASILQSIGEMNVETNLDTVASLSILLLSLSGACAILSIAGKAAGSAISGVATLIVVIAALGIVMAAIGGLVTDMPYLETFLDKGIVILEKIGLGLGSFFGSIIEGFAGGIGDAIVSIGESLSDFMDSIQGFVDGANGIKPESLEGVNTLASMILVLTAADVLNGIASFFGGGEKATLANFGEQLVPFGKSMAQFSEEISGKIDNESVEAAANAGKTLSEMAKNLPSEGGWLQKIFGEQSLDSFSEQLSGFGEAIVAFSQTVDGQVSESAVTSAANGGLALAQLANNLPRQGGALQEFLGEQDLEQFSEQLTSFGEAIVAFSQTVDGQVSESAVEAATNAGLSLANLNSQLPRQGGALQEFLGEQDLEEFGAQLVAFGDAIVEFSSIVSGNVDSEAVDAATNAGMALSGLANSLPKQDGWLGKIFGEQDMGEFGEQLSAFGLHFAMYALYMKAVDTEIIDKTTAAADSIVELANNLPENKLFSNETFLNEFGEQLSEFGSYFYDYYSSVSQIDTSKLNAVIFEVGRLVDTANDMSAVDTDGMKNFGDALEDLGEAGIDDFVNAFTNSNARVTTAVQTFITYFINGVNSKTTELNTAFRTLLDTIVTAISSKYQEFNKAGQTLMTKFVDGMSSKESAAKNLVSNMISSVASTLKNGYSDFYNAGTNLVRGFIDGMEDHMDDVRRAARELAREAYREAMDELDEHSPSRKFFQIGEYVAVGFANGISDNERIAGKSAKSMANTALTTVKETLSRLSDEISNDVDVQPTIRPVLDLTDVTSKSAQLNALFSRNQAMAISSSMASRSTYTPEQTTSTRPETGATFQFTQNNYSPKALSRVEIYRQTKNQFSAMERMMTT